jgi:hypothetical protein
MVRDGRRRDAKASMQVQVLTAHGLGYYLVWNSHLIRLSKNADGSFIALLCAFSYQPDIMVLLTSPSRHCHDVYNLGPHVDVCGSFPFLLFHLVLINLSSILVTQTIALSHTSSFIFSSSTIKGAIQQGP